MNALACDVGEGATSCCLGALQRPGGAAHRIAQRSKLTTQKREKTTPEVEMCLCDVAFDSSTNV